MGSIIAISAQDVNGIGKLGYDNATLVAWNEGVIDRLIPKKDFTSLIKLSKEDNPVTFIYPFLTKMYNYFQATRGISSENPNFAYGGLNFAYRDFLAYLARIDERNNFKAIIPTELSVTLDGIGGIVIGNIFSINQDIIPKGYRSTSGRRLAYIVTRISHNLQDNDWTTTLNAYPIIFENKEGVNAAQDWDNQQYPGAKPGENVITLSAGGTVIARIPNRPALKADRIASFGDVSKAIPLAARPLLDTIAYAEGTAGVSQNGYDVLVGFGQISEWTENYDKGHPDKLIQLNSKLKSTAAGRYQFLTKTWKGLNLTNFNKSNQDAGGWQLIKNTGFTAQNATAIYTTAKSQIQSGQIDFSTNSEFLLFLDKTYLIWASLPSSKNVAGYDNQGGKYSPADIYNIYIEAVNKY
jgi:muramidase (phage lysozyme)